MRKLAAQWFMATEGNLSQRSSAEHIRQHGASRASHFLRTARTNSRTTTLARNPLLCLALVRLFQSSHQLPVARGRIFDYIIELLLSHHPAARAQAAMSEPPANTLNLSEDDFREMLVRLAFEIQSGSSVDAIPAARCRRICAEFLEDENEGLGLTAAAAKQGSRDAVKCLTLYFGLMVSKGSDLLGFVHLSIQEHLAADRVSRMTEMNQLEWLG